MKECILCKQKHNEKGHFCSKSCQVKYEIDNTNKNNEFDWATLIMLAIFLQLDKKKDDICPYCKTEKLDEKNRIVCERCHKILLEKLKEN